MRDRFYDISIGRGKRKSMKGVFITLSHWQALGRPTRIVRGKNVDAAWVVTESLFDCEEERALYSALVGVQVCWEWDMEQSATM